MKEYVAFTQMTYFTFIQYYRPLRNTFSFQVYYSKLRYIGESKIIDGEKEKYVQSILHQDRLFIYGAYRFIFFREIVGRHYLDTIRRSQLNRTSLLKLLSKCHKFYFLHLKVVLSFLSY